MAHCLKLRSREVIVRAKFNLGSLMGKNTHSEAITMTANDIETDKELQQVLWACYEYWQRESVPPGQRLICYSWALGPYRERFGRDFHQSGLSRLARLGFLKTGDPSRGGHRRYYRLVAPDQVRHLLAMWKVA